MNIHTIHNADILGTANLFNYFGLFHLILPETQTHDVQHSNYTISVWFISSM